MSSSGSLRVLSVVVAGIAAFASATASARSASADGGGEVDTFYGSFGTEVPVEVPRFHDLEPRLKLGYSSTGGGGLAGVGWGLSSFGAVTRAQPGGGAPRYDASDVFALDGQELVPCVAGSTSPSCLTGGTHSTRIEGYNKIRFDAASNSWSVWQKDGTRATYAPVYSVGASIFRWGLSSVVDTHANTVSYGWWCDPGADCYPDSISYAGTVIRLYREARPDPIVFATGASLGRTSYRLKTIDVVVSGARARAYRLAYTTSASTGRSVLASVQKFGSNAAVDASGTITSGTPLPAMTMTSSAATLNFGAAYWGGHGGGQTNNALGDFNGDGKTDMSGYAGSGQWHTCLSTGGGFNCGMWAGHGGGQTNNVVADFNGDGKADMSGYAGNGQWHTCLSTGSGFNCAMWAGHGGGQSNNVVVDLNGDGKADMAGYTGSGGVWHVCLSTGSGFNCSYWNGHGGGTANNFSGDYNGDGKVDMAGYAGSGQWHVCLSTGSGFNCSMWAGHGGGQTNNVLGDYNGDGKIDMAGYTGSGGVWHTCLSTGTGFSCSMWNGHGGGASNNFNGDFNGDGKTDMAGYAGSGQWHVTWAAGAVPDLLATISNGLGGATTIGYAPSSQWANTFLPVGTVMQTVASLTTSDGRGASGTTSYRYEGALWSSSERRFLGFRKVTGVLDGAGNYTETYYHQHVGCVSKPEVTYYRNAAGGIFSYSAYGYAENATAPYTSVLTDRWDYECNQGSTCRRVVTQIGYDAYGNAIQTKEWGDFDVAGDERTTVRGYYANAGAYIVSKAAYENVYEGIGTAGALKRQTLFEYDANSSYAVAPTVGELRRKKGWNGQTGGYSLTSYGFDAAGNLTSQTDALGATSTTAYDATYNVYPVRKCDPLGRCSTQVWNGVLGVMTSTTDANGYTTSFTHDVLGRPVRRTMPDGGWVQYDYLDWGNPNAQRTRETRSDGSADGLWRDVYQDGLGRTWLTLEEGGYRESTVYADTSGRVWKKSLPYATGATPVYQTFAYDGSGRLRTVQNPDGTVAQTIYANGQVTTLNELGHEKVTRKDGLGRVTQVLEKLAGTYRTTQYRYDVLGNLVQTTDAVGNASTFTWDSLGRKIGQCDVDLGCWSYVYDAVGHLTRQTDAKGQPITFAYDALGRMTSKTLPNGAQARWTYDEAGHGAGLGKPTTIVNDSGTESLTYDWAGRVTSATRCVTGTCLTMSYTFDAAGRPRTITYPDGEVVTNTYGADGRLQSMGYASFAYNAAGQPTTITYANGTTTAYTYDANRMWLSSARVTAAGSTLYESTYGYDAAARVSSMSYTGSNGFQRSSTFGYDELSRLTSSTRDGQAWQSFTYDALGNVTGQDLVGVYGYGDAAHKHAVTSAGSNSYSYDANGNMVAGGGRSYAFDAENRVSSITQGGQTTSFKYDAQGQRVEKIGGGSTVRYFGQLLEKRDGLAETKYYYAGSMLVAERRWDGATYYHHRDHVSSVRLTTTSSGAVARRYEYRPFGYREGTSGTVANEWEYGGHQTDAESGLVYMGARYYDPLIGRFVSPDSIIPDPHNPQALNRYAYVLNNPISNADPTGHVPVVAAVITAVAVAAVETAPVWLTAMAYVGAATTIAGYVLEDPTLMTIGGVLLGFSGGYAFGAGFLAGPGMAGGMVTATVAAATSPLSPLDPGIKQAVGWAFTAQSVIHGLWGEPDVDVTDPKWSEDPTFSKVSSKVQRDMDSLCGGSCTEANAQGWKTKAMSEADWAPDWTKAHEIGHYGSDTHAQFGLAVEKLTGGRISAADAMMMSPCGGMVGPGCGTSSQILSGIFPKGAVYQHALVHDASGFLKTNFNVGVGYTYAGQLVLGATNPLGGQVTGIVYNMRGRWVPGLATSYTDND